MLNKRKIKLAANADKLHEVEYFVENVCDHYHILNSYFGHIMFAVTQTFLYAVEHIKNESQHLTITCSSDAQGLIFQISLGSYYYELAAVFQRELEVELTRTDLKQDEQNILIVRMLCDDVRLNESLSAIQLVFYISSINEHMTQERLKELDLYYERLTQHKVVS